MESHSRQVTLDEVAARAGVSRSAASRVLNDAPHVSKAKREAVRRAIAELGYVPNATARALASRQSGSVVLAVSAEDPAVFADQFVAEVVVGILSVLEETDLELTLVTATSSRGQQRLEKLLRSRTTAGVMLMSMHGDEPIARLAEDAELPVVFGGQPLTFEPRYYVDADNRGGARLATEHLIGIGRTRIATITGRMDEAAGTARYKGFQETLAVAGLDPRRVVHGDFSEDGGQRAMTELLARHPETDAVFVASDQMAIGALGALTAAGRSVPSDVAVVGFNDIPMARHTTPPLTTISQPIRSLGREMARMLHAVLNGEHPSPLILPTRLVFRDSAAGPSCR
ncbi:DNA-binding LacI/PurR family transcriptional regulator [Kribbella aluminosa]|uniref:DNA-binding LacI/PurR family transcriptional regulator n=1 Tax=Kribbella aluminosa TaxID=416017 RepID=A0ABS4UVX2_9ACTN|nr:LacI family DNA-binding transcriptional regulator [Kribbella aluminosa]MBP2355798.1 DNA-binding LacI/PurR family transcriptional regulator [Kribbella aluminosa]